MDSSGPALPIRFGIFEIDVQAGELLREGIGVKLQNQPFQVLMMLLERPGGVVTREALQERLWPGSTFGDFDQGLNKAINGLRAALADSARQPRFIETLPQRGYRFIAPVVYVKPMCGRVDSLAVLPLENLSDDPGEEYFSDGMTEELICAVAKIPSLRVISRTSVMFYKGVRRPLPEIARELRVDAVVEGTVSRAAGKIRITAQLIHAPEDRHLWSGRYERDLSDVLSMQAEIAADIAGQIQKAMLPDAAGLALRPRVHPEAYEACLKGNFIRDKMTPIDLMKSIEYFHRAIELCPTYAQAYGDLSQTYFYLGLFGVRSSQETFSQAKWNAAKALELDETIAIAHNSMAAVHVLFDWDWARAETECRRAMELSPGHPVMHVHFADYLSIRARHDEAAAAFGRALELDPISRVYLAHFGLILHRARRYDESIAQCRKALEIDPNYANALWFLGLSLEQKGDLSQAIATLEKAVSLTAAPHHRALLGRAYALAGESAQAHVIIGKLTALSGERYVSPFDFAVVHAGLGDRDAAFHWLEEAYRQRVFRLVELTLPMFDHLRPDSRWRDLACRVGLPV